MTVYGPGAPKYGRGGRPLRRRQKRTITSVKRSCDRLWPMLVKARADYRCERCGGSPEGQNFHAHHVYKRNNHRLRWEPRNGIALCARCHRWAEDNPLPFTDWFREKRSLDSKWLEAQNQKGLIKRGITEYLELEEALREALREGEV